MRVYQRGTAAFVPVYPWLGVGSNGRRGAGVLRVGAYFDLQEVTIMRVRMVCIRLPRFMGSVVRLLTGKRRT